MIEIRGLKIGDIPNIISAIGTTLLLIFVALEGHSGKITALVLIIFILFIVLVVYNFHFDLWNKLKKKFRAFKLHIRVPELVKDFEDIRARFDDKFAYQSQNATIFHIVISSELVRDKKFSDIFRIFEMLRDVFSNRTYSDFKTECDSFSKRKIKKKEDFVISILRVFIAVLQAHGRVIESFLALVENKRYKEASKEAVKEFTTFKGRYNSYLEDCENFIKRVNRNLEKDLHSEFERIKDEDVSKLVKLSKKERSIIAV